jgi:hypothetical protein
MKRLTVHLSGVKKKKETRKDSNGKEILKDVIYNTVTFNLSGPNYEQDANMILSDLEKAEQKVTKHYFTNLV